MATSKRLNKKSEIDVKWVFNKETQQCVAFKTSVETKIYSGIK